MGLFDTTAYIKRMFETTKDEKQEKHYEYSFLFNLYQDGAISDKSLGKICSKQDKRKKIKWLKYLKPKYLLEHPELFDELDIEEKELDDLISSLENKVEILKKIRDNRTLR